MAKRKGRRAGEDTRKAGRPPGRPGGTGASPGKTASGPDPTGRSRDRSLETSSTQSSDRGSRAQPTRMTAARGNRQQADASRWLYGLHAVSAALANPRRRRKRFLATTEGLAAIARHLETPADGADLVDRREIESVLPPGAVHQGVALLADPLPETGIEDLLARCSERALLVLLDQVTDPQNVGAILRSAAAFGALAVVQPERQAAPVTGALAKAASGALESLPLIGVTNLARTLDLVQRHDFLCLGLDGDAALDIDGAPPADRTALVLGAEGTGLRRLTRERCDMLVRLPTQPPIASLNVSSAAAIALYARRPGRDR